MITLKRVIVNKYKSIRQQQTVEIEPSITTIVGLNESGKTNFLQVMAKTNYFNNDADFKFDITSDYPRNELVSFENSGEDVKIVECCYEISDDLMKLVEDEVGKGVFTGKTFSESYYYKKSVKFSSVEANQKKYIELKVQNLILSRTTKETLSKLNSLNEALLLPQLEGDVDLITFKTELKKITDANAGYANWDNKLAQHIFFKWIYPQLPKFWYFDDYYHLGGKININELQNNRNDEKMKTARALFELAKINPNDVLNAQDYERFVARLETSAKKITEEIFTYWSTSQNMDIDLKIQEKADAKYLDIRVRSRQYKISLPLDRRSKGFNWFFSFIVWFSKIQADNHSKYILLLDEPGLNLHAAAQADLLKFFDALSLKYQVIYTTHSPFMLDAGDLQRVRTCLETEEGTMISDLAREKDPQTLFPLRAALGYDIARNLFVSQNNLLVDGPADLLYLTVLSNILETEGRTSLNKDISIVPVGGLGKVCTFMSLSNGFGQNAVYLFDGKHRTTIEDLFEKEDRLKLFGEKPETANRYQIACRLLQIGADKNYFSEKTLNNFEQLFVEVNGVKRVNGETGEQ